MNNFQLYYLCEPDTDEVRYVGITKNGLKKRLSQHLSKPTNEIIGEWFNKLKINNKKPIIKEVGNYNSYDDLLISEYNEIKRLKDRGYNLFNVMDGGLVNPMLGRTHTDKVKQIISKKNTGKHRSEITIEKIKNSLVKRWSENSNLREKMSQLNSGNKNPFYGKTHSSETIEKLKRSSKNRGGFIGKKNPNFKYVIIKEDLYRQYIHENKTIKDISEFYNCSINTINKNLRKYKINKPPSNFYKLNIQEITKFLNDGLNYVQIGKKYGCCNKIIHKFIKKHNLYV
jgi:hypothetical protein